MSVTSQITVGDFSLPAEGDECSHCHANKQNRGSIQLLPSVELGHMFCLGDRYSESLGLHCPEGNVMMGCYGLGLSRMMGALFQLYGFNSGVLFPDAITTYDVVLVNVAKSEQSRKVMIELLDALSDVRIMRIVHK